MRKIIFSILAVLMAIFILGGCTSNKQTTGLTVMDGKFTVGFDQNFPPMGFVGDDGEFTGFDLELAAEVADRLGLELELQPIAWDAKDEELSAKNIDCIWNGFTMNGREDGYTWTEPYMANNQVFVVRANSEIATLDDLAGKSVAVQVDSSAEAALEDNPELLESFGEYVTAADYNNALMDLEASGVEAVAMDEIVNYRIQQAGGQFRFYRKHFRRRNMRRFPERNEALRDKVQEVLEEMAEDGTLKEISEKWFGKINHHREVNFICCYW